RVLTSGSTPTPTLFPYTTLFRSVHQAVTQLYRIGLDDIRGYLRNGMTDWQNAALPLNRLQEWTVHELNARREAHDVQVLDVRSSQEVVAGRVPGASIIFVEQLANRLKE